MLGAENRGNVTCYLDSLLFAMFSRLDAFECMLKKAGGNENQKRLATLIRLWVNMLRAGKLIDTDMVSWNPKPCIVGNFLANPGALDSTNPRSPRSLRLEGCRTTRATGHVRGVCLYHRDSPASSSDTTGRPLPPGERRRGRSQGCI